MAEELKIKSVPRDIASRVIHSSPDLGSPVGDAEDNPVLLHRPASSVQGRMRINVLLKTQKFRLLTFSPATVHDHVRLCMR